MNLLHNIILVAQILSAVGMIGLVLVQQGKGADMGAAFGSGGSGSLFGATGGANFLSRSTAVLATVFFLCTLALGYLSTVRTAQPASAGSVLERTAPAANTDPSVPAPAGISADPKAPANNIPR